MSADQDIRILTGSRKVLIKPIKKKYQPPSEPIIVQGNTEIYFDILDGKNIAYIAKDKSTSKYYYITDVPDALIVKSGGGIGIFKESMYSILTAKMVGGDINIKKYMKAISEVIPDEIQGYIFLPFENYRVSRKEYFKEKDFVFKEYILKSTDEYTVYLYEADYKRAQTSDINLPTKYAIIIEIEDLIDPQILIAWLSSKVHKKLQTFF